MPVIRDALPDRDAAACAAIYAPYVRDGAASFEEQPPDAAAIARRIRACGASHDWLVAEQAGVLTGFAYACPHRDRAAYRWAADVTVYVAAGHAGAGIGRALYAELLARLRAQGLRSACAGITLPNDASVGLHLAMGFEVVGTYRSIGWKHGAWRDVCWLQLDLAPEIASPPPEPLPGRQ